MPIKSLAVASALVLGTFAFIAPHADAAIIDFEDVASEKLIINSSVISEGFVVTHAGSFAELLNNLHQGATDFSGDGTNRLISFNTSTITVSSQNGSNFNVSSFLGGESWISMPHYWSTQIEAVATLAGGGTTTQDFNLDIIKNPLTGMQLFQFNSSFKNLTKVTFHGIGRIPEFSLDNITTSAATSAVPEPETYAMLLAGLGLMGFVARRKA